MFERIYKLYPRKTGGRKQTAYKHFLAHLRGKGKRKLTPEQMAVAVQWYTATVIDKEPQYIQMAQTFFNETIESFVRDEEGG